MLAEHIFNRLPDVLGHGIVRLDYIALLAEVAPALLVGTSVSM